MLSAKGREGVASHPFASLRGSKVDHTLAVRKASLRALGSL